jgi:hypothetical protein
MILLCTKKVLSLSHDEHSLSHRKMYNCLLFDIPPLSHLTSCTPSKSDLHLSNSPTTDLIAPTLHRLLIFQVYLTSFFHCLGRAKESVQVRRALKHFATNYFFTVRGC